MQKLLRGGFLLLSLCALTLTSCAKEKSNQADVDPSDASPGARWSSFPVTLRADTSVLQDPEREADLRAALHFWEAHAGKKLFDYRGERTAWKAGRPYAGADWQHHPLASNVVYVENDWPFHSGGDAHVAGRTLIHSRSGWIENAVVLIRKENTAKACPTCSSPLVESPMSRRALITHELGHFLGFGHSKDPKNIMYPVVDPMRYLDEYEVDEATLQTLTK